MVIVLFCTGIMSISMVKQSVELTCCYRYSYCMHKFLYDISQLQPLPYVNRKSVYSAVIASTETEI